MRSGPRYKLPTANPSPFRGEGLIEGAGRGCAPVLGIISGFGDNGGGETPVPFPNTEVKPSSADGTAGVTRRESRSSPSIFFESRQASGRRDSNFFWTLDHRGLRFGHALGAQPG